MAAAFSPLLLAERLAEAPVMKPTAILVVDDDLDTCRNLSDILIDLGQEVDTAQSGPAALDLVRQRHYDIALLDLKMPDMDGLNLYRELKKLSADTVAIIVTAYASGTTAEEAGAAGIWQVLPKPIDLPKLLDLVSNALGQPLVLLVDDDPDLCASLWDVLREHGYRVCLAHNEEEALDRLRKKAFEIVLIDMKLPASDGRHVFQHVRQLNPSARTVLITGYRSEMEQIVQQVLAEGADAACYKPFDMPHLLATLERPSPIKRRNA
jgi:CheY-like chemotaxis protein